MADVKQILKKIEGKLRMLEFTRDDTPRIRQKNELKSLERHEKVFGELIENIHEQKVQVQVARIEGDNADEVKQWTLQMEEKIAGFEELMAELQTEVKDLQKKTVQEARKEEEQRDEDKRKRHYEEEMKLEEEKMRMKHEFEKNVEEAKSKSLKESKSNAKLPKLVITKFQGTPLDWQRLWSQFETETDEAEIGQVAKFSYLKDLLIYKV